MTTSLRIPTAVKKRTSALKHRVTRQVEVLQGKHLVRKFVTIFMTDEGVEQLCVVDWLALHKIDFYHIPNESKRSPQEGFMLKLLGLQPCASDLIITTRPPLFPECRGVALEMKSRTGTATPGQKQWQQDRVERDGYLVNICRGADTAIAWLQSLGYGA